MGVGFAAVTEDDGGLVTAGEAIRSGDLKSYHPDDVKDWVLRQRAAALAALPVDAGE
ncbi:MAG TPA: hypothetical protein VE440_02230 [Gaiellaceae bacterium]|jgi:hypothetical protein|nr:hypothetical protein [Gaiellaceae bacterium]